MVPSKVSKFVQHDQKLKNTQGKDKAGEVEKVQTLLSNMVAPSHMWLLTQQLFEIKMLN